MALRRLDLRGFTGSRRQLRAALPAPADEQDRSSDAVAAIIAEVRADGDAALRRLTERFDGIALDELRVPESEIQAALSRIPTELQDALGIAHGILGLSLALTVPNSLHHHMRVGLGYLRYHQHASSANP